MASTWGRRETLITPPTVPVYTFTAFGVALMCIRLFAWQKVAFSMPIMQRSYFTEYFRAAVGSAFHQTGEYRLFYLDGAKKRPPRLALPVDFEDGQTTLPNGKTVPVQLTALPQAQGYRWFGRSLPQKFQDASLYRWLRFTFFAGRSVPRLFLPSYIEAGATASHHALVCRPRGYQAAESVEVWPRPPWPRDDEPARVSPCRHERVLASSSG